MEYLLHSVHSIITQKKRENTNEQNSLLSAQVHGVPIKVNLKIFSKTDRGRRAREEEGEKEPVRK